MSCCTRSPACTARRRVTCLTVAGSTTARSGGTRCRTFRRRLQESTGGATVPQVVIDGEPVGDATRLAWLDPGGCWCLWSSAGASRAPSSTVAARAAPAATPGPAARRKGGVWRYRVELRERDGRTVAIRLARAQPRPSGSRSPGSARGRDRRMPVTIARASGGTARCPRGTGASQRALAFGPVRSACCSSDAPPSRPVSPHDAARRRRMGGRHPSAGWRAAINEPQAGALVRCPRSRGRTR